MNPSHRKQICFHIVYTEDMSRIYDLKFDSASHGKIGS